MTRDQLNQVAEASDEGVDDVLDDLKCMSSYYEDDEIDFKKSSTANVMDVIAYRTITSLRDLQWR